MIQYLDMTFWISFLISIIVYIFVSGFLETVDMSLFSPFVDAVIIASMISISYFLYTKLWNRVEISEELEEDSIY